MAMVALYQNDEVAQEEETVPAKTCVSRNGGLRSRPVNARAQNLRHRTWAKSRVEERKLLELYT